jgi:hypothetical protein
MNPGEKIIFENKEFRHCKDKDGDTRFDTWVLKSPGTELHFQKEGFFAKITTAKFPHGLFGYGYTGSALHNSEQCYCHGDVSVSTKTFKTEFEAQCAAINYILKHNEIVSGWNQHFVKLQMIDFINPKTLF